MKRKKPKGKRYVTITNRGRAIIFCGKLETLARVILVGQWAIGLNDSALTRIRNWCNRELDRLNRAQGRGKNNAE